MSVLAFVSRDFELGRTWLAGGVDHQSCMGLMLIFFFLASLAPGQFFCTSLLVFCQPVHIYYPG